jgi:hypothetical protein
MSSPGVAPTVRLIAHAASVEFSAPVAVFVDHMASHVAFGELAGVSSLTMAALD